MNAPFFRDPVLRGWLKPKAGKRGDGFCGGGGVSEAIKRALGRGPDVAVNHSPVAIAMHAKNHPETKHLCENIRKVHPQRLFPGEEWEFLWFSPDCTYHSRARGGKPFRDRHAARRRRGLMWEVPRWAKAVKPAVLFVENVPEVRDWGPLLEDGTPDPARKGETFARWVAMLRNLGYVVEWRELKACDFGAPTSRKRLFIVARRDGHPIVWPTPTHGPGRAKPYRTAAECIDWSIPAPSIFLTREEAKAWGKAHGCNAPRRPLSEKTMARIARGIFRYILKNPRPFIVPVTHAGERRPHFLEDPLPTITGANRGELALVAPTLIQTSYGEREGQAPRSLDIQAPIGTVVAGGVKHSLVAAFLARHYGGHENDGEHPSLPFHTITARDHHALVSGHLLKLRGTSDAHIEASGASLAEPLPTVSAQGNHLAEVQAFLVRYNGTSEPQDLQLPLTTVDTTDRFGLVMVHGVPHVIVDITMRMLKPRELFNAHGFAPDYEIENVDGRTLTSEEQIEMVGNSVPVDLAEALIRAQYEYRAEAAA